MSTPETVLSATGVLHKLVKMSRMQATMRTKQKMQKQTSSLTTCGRSKVTAVTTDVNQPVTSSMVQEIIVSERVHPPISSSTVVTTVSSTITSTALT